MNCTKGYIIKVGEFNKLGEPIDWIIGYCSIGLYGSLDGTRIYGGYSIKDLKEIHESYSKYKRSNH